MATEAAIFNRVRNLLGDAGEQFRTSYRGDGSTDTYQLPVQNVSPNDLKVFIISGADLTDLTPADYTLDVRNGLLELHDVVAIDDIVVVEGLSYGLFSDEDLGVYVNDALLQHTNGRTTTIRYRNANGFIRYADVPLTLESLPEVEDAMVAILAALEALWALSTDASTDIDVITGEGTHLPRSQRWAQLMRQIEVLDDKYKALSQQLNVGLYRIEVSTLRRVSMQTGRLVPVFKAREYDDSRRPTRLLPPIDADNIDESGIPSPAFGWYP